MSVEIGKGDFMGPSAAQFFHKSEKKKKREGNEKFTMKGRRSFAI